MAHPVSLAILFAFHFPKENENAKLKQVALTPVATTTNNCYTGAQHLYN